MLQNKSEKEIYELSKSLLDLPAEESLEYVTRLGEVLRYHEWKYYVDNSPIISDFEYDQLYKKLEAVEQTHPEWILADSPSQRVSSDLTSEFRTVPHIVPMLSLDNSYNEADLNKFDEQIRKLTGINTGDIVYTVEPKFDGGSVAIIYDKDIMSRAATRGNGEEGEEITLNAKQILTLPLNAAFSRNGITKAELRGEAVIDKTRFAEINLQREKDGKTLFANPRNTATGGLRTKDPKETRDRGTELFVFQMGYAEDINGNNILGNFKGHFETMGMLKGLGFRVDHDILKQCHGIQEVIDHCRLWETKRESYPYEKRKNEHLHWRCPNSGRNAAHRGWLCGVFWRDVLSHS